MTGKRWAAVLLAIPYLFTLAMSTFHLAELYELFDTQQKLPWSLSYGFAASLELTAFGLSLVSNVVKPRIQWAMHGATLSLLLVWAGNLYQMAQSPVPLFVVIGASFFSPMTLILGKVIGELLEGKAEVVEPKKKVATFVGKVVPPHVANFNYKADATPTVFTPTPVKPIPSLWPEDPWPHTRPQQIMNFMAERKALASSSSVNSKQLAEHIKCSVQTISREMKALKERGEVQSNTNGYWLAAPRGENV